MVTRTRGQSVNFCFWNIRNLNWHESKLVQFLSISSNQFSTLIRSRARFDSPIIMNALGRYWYYIYIGIAIELSHENNYLIVHVFKTNYIYYLTTESWLFERKCAMSTLINVITNDE